MLVCCFAQGLCSVNLGVLWALFGSIDWGGATAYDTRASSDWRLAWMDHGGARGVSKPRAWAESR